VQAKPRARRRTSCRAPAGSRLVHASHLFSLLSPKAAEDATVIIEHTSARRAESIAAIGSPPTLLNEDNPRLRKQDSLQRIRHGFFLPQPAIPSGQPAFPGLLEQPAVAA